MSPHPSTRDVDVFDIVETAWAVSRITEGVAPITAVVPKKGSHGTRKDSAEHLLLIHGEPSAWSMRSSPVVRMIIGAQGIAADSMEVAQEDRGQPRG